MGQVTNSVGWRQDQAWMEAGSIFSLTPDYIPKLVAYYLLFKSLSLLSCRGGRDGCCESILLYHQQAIHYNCDWSSMALQHARYCTNAASIFVMSTTSFLFRCTLFVFHTLCFLEEGEKLV
jgi:hypothetical protein